MFHDDKQMNDFAVPGRTCEQQGRDEHMQLNTKIGLAVGLGAGAVVAGGLWTALSQARRDEPTHANENGNGTRGLAPGGTSPGDDPNPYPSPGDGTSPGDDPVSMPVRGTIDPSGWFDDYSFNGSLNGSHLDATVDPRGWGNDVQLSGRVDYSGFDTRIDPRGWGNDTVVRGARTASGFEATVDRPGIWNDVKLRLSETVRGAQVIREGRFDESLTPSFSEASWRSEPVGTGGGARVLTFDPPGFANNIRVDLVGNPPAGVEATIASYLFDQWKTEQERIDDYPDPSYPDPTGPGDDYPTGPGDDYPTAPGYPTGPGDEMYPYPGSDYPTY